MINRFVRLTGNLLFSSVITMMLAFAAFSQAPQAPQNSQPPTSSQTHPVEGTYSVTATSAELGTINFLMALKQSGEKWTGEIKDSPTPLALSTITVDESNKVTITADAGGTAVTINGKLDGTKIAGDWAAGDIRGTWTAVKKSAEELKAGEKNVASAGSSSVSAAAAAGLEGSYDAKVIADGQGELPFTLLIKRDGDQLVTEVQGGGDLNITSITVKDPDEVTLTATYQGNGPIPLNGKRTGDELGGKWAAGPFSGTWSAKKKTSEK